MRRMTWRASPGGPCGEGGGVHAAAGAGRHQGKPVQVEPMKPTLKVPGTKRLNLKYDELLSSFAFNFNLRRYIKASGFSSGVTYMKALKGNLTDLQFPRRQSREFMEDKSRPLATKLNDFLDYLFRCVCVFMAGWCELTPMLKAPGCSAWKSN